jgi:biotin carboxyl carrier protein
MKMEIPVESPTGGTVRELFVAEGEAVEDGQWLLTLD